MSATFSRKYVPAYAWVIARPHRVQSLDAIDFFDAHGTRPVFNARFPLRHGVVREKTQQIPVPCAIKQAGGGS